MNKSDEALLMSIFGQDSEGNVFVRLVVGKPESGLKNVVNTQSNISLTSLLRKVIVLDKNKNPALHIVNVDFSESFEKGEMRRFASMAKNEKSRQERLKDGFK
tara:strand:+ start:28334 stop:28642 length:309 start_codon:yes stop_codon:yes gene_type:complete